MARWFHAPAVSIVTGKKIWVFSSSPYLAILLTAAAGSVAVSPMRESANVSGTVTSQASGLPVAQGSSVGPSGRFLLCTVRLTGSFTAGILLLFFFKFIFLIIISAK